MANQDNVFGDIDQLAALVARRERRRLVFVAIGVLCSILFAIALIFYAGMYVASAKQQVDLAKQQVDLLEERKSGLEKEIAIKTAQLNDISSRLQKATTPQESKAVAEFAAVQAAQGSRLVYLQFRGALSRDTMRGLQAALQQNKYIAPGIERVAASYGNEVRYFRKEDAENAKNVAALAVEYFSQKCPAARARDFPARLTSTQNQLPPPQIEIWVSINCDE